MQKLLKYNNMKKSVQILIIAFIGVVTVNTAKAQTYDPLAVQRINDLIANNGLQATPNAPETWAFAEWNNENPKKIINLNLGDKYMEGSASFAGLTTLQTLNCNWGYLTKLDVTNCTQLKTLQCRDNRLTTIDITNCKQLQRIECYQNHLTKLDVTNCTQLQTLWCSVNRLIELDLTGRDKLTEFDGNHQFPPALTLYKNEAEEYTCVILLNNPTFESSAISYSDGVLKSTDTTVLYTPFTVQTNKEGFELSGTMSFIYSDEVGIDSIDDAKLTVYPNPATGELIVTGYELQVTNIEIFDVNGKRQKAESRRQKAEGEMVIDISHLPIGIYFVKVITEQGEVVKKIVKQ